MKHYLHEVADVFAEVKSSEVGLTSAEAEKRLEANGKNKLAEAMSNNYSLCQLIVYAISCIFD